MWICRNRAAFSRCKQNDPRIRRWCICHCDWKKNLCTNEISNTKISWIAEARNRILNLQFCTWSSLWSVSCCSHIPCICTSVSSRANRTAWCASHWTSPKSGKREDLRNLLKKREIPHATMPTIRRHRLSRQAERTDRHFLVFHHRSTCENRWSYLVLSGKTLYPSDLPSPRISPSSWSHVNLSKILQLLQTNCHSLTYFLKMLLLKSPPLNGFLRLTSVL